MATFHLQKLTDPAKQYDKFIHSNAFGELVRVLACFWLDEIFRKLVERFHEDLPKLELGLFIYWFGSEITFQTVSFEFWHQSCKASRLATLAWQFSVEACLVTIPVLQRPVPATTIIVIIKLS